MPDYDKSQLQELLSNLVDEKLSERELNELQALLRDDPDAQQFYIKYTMLHSWLTWDYIEQSPAESRLLSLNKQNPFDSAKSSPILGFLGDWASFLNHHSPLSFVLLFVIFGATLLATTYLLSTRHSGTISAEPVFIAQITATKDCQWSTTIPSPTEMMSLKTGQQLQLEKGLAQITYSNGAVVLLEGPVSFTVDSAKSGFLSRGKLTARADTQQSRQFAVATPDARFVDLGTEFGVMIDEKGRAAVAVFTGKVNAEAKLAGGRWSTPVALRAGEAVVCVETKFTPQVAQRSDFPSLKPLPPPPPESSFQRWLGLNQELQSRRDLVAYYDFQPDPIKPNKLPNRSRSGAALDGIVQNAKWVDGRFVGKKALEFKINDSGVQVNLPQDELTEVTLITWVNVIKLLENEYSNHNGLLMSDGWKKSFETHWFMQIDGRLTLAMENETGNIEGAGIGDGTGVLGTEKTEAWTSMTDHIGQWCMLATVYNTSTKSITNYFNGVAVETIALTETPRVKFGSATIGGWCPSREQNKTLCTLKGRIDELMIFNSALSAHEIQAIYIAGKPE